MGHKDSNRNTQRGRLLRLLIDARGDWVSLPEILAIGAAQFGARLLELRGLGFKIENRMETVDGKKLSWYRLVSGPSLPTPTPAPISPRASTPDTSLFGDLTPTRYPD